MKAPSGEAAAMKAGSGETVVRIAAPMQVEPVADAHGHRVTVIRI